MTSSLIMIMIALTGLIVNNHAVRINGNSMFPAIKNKEWVVYQQTQDIKENDVIVFDFYGKLVCHRVVKIGKEGWIWTKGDWNERLDRQPITIDRVKGKVIFVIDRKGKMRSLIERKD